MVTCRGDVCQSLVASYKQDSLLPHGLSLSLSPVRCWALESASTERQVPISSGTKERTCHSGSLKYKCEPRKKTSDAGKRKDSRALPGQHWEPMVTQSRGQGGWILRHSHSESPPPPPEKGVCWSALLLQGVLNPHGIGGVQVAVVGAC